MRPSDLLIGAAALLPIALTAAGGMKKLLQKN
jgi:hypothetical protein